MAAFSFFIGSDPVYFDPPQGRNEGTEMLYNILQGKIGSTGEFYSNPLTLEKTKYALSGDPILKTGWIDGILHPPGDRRIVVCAGPFK